MEVAEIPKETQPVTPTTPPCDNPLIARLATSLLLDPGFEGHATFNGQGVHFQHRSQGNTLLFEEDQPILNESYLRQLIKIALIQSPPTTVSLTKIHWRATNAELMTALPTIKTWVLPKDTPRFSHPNYLRLDLREKILLVNPKTCGDVGEMLQDVTSNVDDWKKGLDAVSLFPDFQDDAWVLALTTDAEFEGHIDPQILAQAIKIADFLGASKAKTVFDDHLHRKLKIRSERPQLIPWLPDLLKASVDGSMPKSKLTVNILFQQLKSQLERQPEWAREWIGFNLEDWKNGITTNLGNETTSPFLRGVEATLKNWLSLQHVPCELRLSSIRLYGLEKWWPEIVDHPLVTSIFVKTGYLPAAIFMTLRKPLRAKGIRIEPNPKTGGSKITLTNFFSLGNTELQHFLAGTNHLPKPTTLRLRIKHTSADPWTQKTVDQARKFLKAIHTATIILDKKTKEQIGQEWFSVLQQRQKKRRSAKKMIFDSQASECTKKTVWEAILSGKVILERSVEEFNKIPWGKQHIPPPLLTTSQEEKEASLAALNHQLTELLPQDPMVAERLVAVIREWLNKGETQPPILFLIQPYRKKNNKLGLPKKQRLDPNLHSKLFSAIASWMGLPPVEFVWDNDNFEHFLPGRRDLPSVLVQAIQRAGVMNPLVGIKLNPMRPSFVPRMMRLLSKNPSHTQDACTHSFIAHSDMGFIFSTDTRCWERWKSRLEPLAHCIYTP